MEPLVRRKLLVIRSGAKDRVPDPAMARFAIRLPGRDFAKASHWASRLPSAENGLRRGLQSAGHPKDLPSSVMRITPAGAGAKEANNSGRAPASSLKKTKPITAEKVFSMRCVTEFSHFPE
jgi:hypothetical protein